MKAIGVHYSIRDNLGDAINPLIFKEVLNCEIYHADIYHCDSSGIGSGLSRLFFDAGQCDKKTILRRKLAGIFYHKPLFLWSSGFLETPSDNMMPRRKYTIPIALRGELTKKNVSKYLKINCDHCVAADGGLLASELIKSDYTKKYRIGIIPHDSERGMKAYCELAEDENNVIIDVRADVLTSLKTISQCEYIISSSLHGLIIADSFRVPNQWVVASDVIAGDGYKFADYYSAFGLQCQCVDLRSKKITPNDIIDAYKISPRSVEEKKERLISSFESIRKELRV